MSEASTATKPPNLAEVSPDFNEVSPQRLRQLSAHLRALAAHPGWLYIKQVMASQAAMRLNELSQQQPYSTRDMIEQALQRGEAATFQELINYPEFLEAAMEKQLEAYGIEPEDDELKEHELHE